MGRLSQYSLILAFVCGLAQGQLIAEQPPIISEFSNIVNHIIKIPSDGLVFIFAVRLIKWLNDTQASSKM